jgi:serine-type D-Ala-D-Ala carboxypeptidase (penicillin-binding protein 5/6)
MSDRGRWPRRVPDFGRLESDSPHRSRSRVPLAALGLIPALLIAAFVWRGIGDTQATHVPDPGTGEPALIAALEPAPEEARATEPPAEQPLSLENAPTAPPPVALGIPAPEISASAAIVMDGDSLEVLYERNARVRRSPASLTKIATAIVVAEHANLDDVATSDVHYWMLPDSTVMGLEPGDEVTLRDLLYGLMLVSGNDAAIVLARRLAGSEEAFAIAMNLLVDRLGLQDTRFQNPHGLTEPGHYSTAYDLALLSRHLMSIPELREIVGTEQLIVTGMREGEEVEFDFYNHNPLLNYTPGVDGVKTGFTEDAGRTFAVSINRDDRRVYIVLLDAVERAQDAMALIEWAYEAHTWPGVEPSEP